MAEEPRDAWDDMVLVGRIVRPHGIRGEVVVAPETDFVEERFRPGARLWIRSAGGGEQLTIGAARLRQGRPIVAFAGRSRIEDVERFVGQELRVPESALRPLEPGLYYRHQLVGCLVEAPSGPVGTVRRVDGGRAGGLLVVDGALGEILIPLAADICVEIDLTGRRIRVSPPPGLLELNEPRRRQGTGRDEVRHRHDFSADDRGGAR